MDMTDGVVTRISSWLALSLAVCLTGPGCIDGPMIGGLRRERRHRLPPQTAPRLGVGLEVQPGEAVEVFALGPHREEGEAYRLTARGRHESGPTDVSIVRASHLGAAGRLPR